MTTPKKPNPFSAKLSASLNASTANARRKYRDFSRRAAIARHDRQVAREMRGPSLAEKMEVAHRRAERMTLEQRTELGAASVGAFLRTRFAGSLAVPAEKRWRQAALWLGVVALVSVAGNVLMYFRFTPARPLVTVGSHVIRDREYRGLVDNAAGQPALTRLVFAELIRQAAAKSGVTPSAGQVDARLAEMQRLGQAPAGAVSPDYRDNLALNLALENLRTRSVPVTGAEVAAFYAQHRAVLAEPAQSQTILVVTPREFLAQTAADLLAKGKTAAQMAAEPDMRVDGERGFHVNLNALPPAVHQSVVASAVAMTPGQIKILPLGNVFLTMKCLKSEPETRPTLPAARDRIVRLIKLQKAPSADAEMAMLYKANPPRFDVDRYAAYFSGVGTAPKTASNQ